MSRHPKLLEFEVDRKPPKRSFADYFYDSDTGAILGRTPKSWRKILMFYVIFYSVLAALCAVCWVTFIQQFINPRVPRLQQDYGLIGTSPGLGFRPHPPDVRSTLIWYKGTGYESYKYWEDQLIDFLSEYKKKGQTAGAGQNIYNCDFRNPPPVGKVCDVDIRGWEPCIEENHFSFHKSSPCIFLKLNRSNVGTNIYNCDFRNPPPVGKVCDVDIRGWEPCIEENHFSFHKSSPCIFLKLNRIFGWRPEFYDTHDLPPEMPADLRSHIHNMTAYNPDYANMIWVSCHGETPADQELIGPIKYLPHRGFPGYFYPYNNAEGYLSPLIAIHLEKPRTGIVINIECRAWAPNIKYDRREKLGVVHFELMIE